MASGAPRPSDPFGWAGRVLDSRYRIDEVVGEGGFGIVYAAHHLGFDEPIAVKCLKLGQGIEPARRARFLENFVAEGKILYRLSKESPSIVRAIDVGAATAPSGAWTPYIVLEWVRGITLESELLQRSARGSGGRSVSEAIALLEPAVRALETAHWQGIAHRDVKPANFILTDVNGKPTLKVLDFGVAKVMSTAPTGTMRKGRSLHAFTPSYAAPEQFEHERGETGPWTDVYGLALVFIEVISGRRPYSGRNATEIFLEATDLARRPTPRTIGCSVSDGVERVLARALAVDPRNRPKGAAEFWSELVEAAKAAPGAPAAAIVTTITETPIPAIVRPQTEPDPGPVGASTVTAGASSPIIVDHLIASRAQSDLAHARQREPPRRRSRRAAWVALLLVIVGTTCTLVAKRGDWPFQQRSAATDTAMVTTTTVASSASSTPSASSVQPSMTVTSSSVPIAPSASALTTDAGKAPARGAGCVPRTCDPRDCGAMPNDCGQMVSCGSCPPRRICQHHRCVMTDNAPSATGSASSDTH